MPSAEQMQQYKQELKELLAAQEAINKLSPQKRQVMNQAANTSKARRKGAR